jgi:acyl-CoA dehydrogenase
VSVSVASAIQPYLEADIGPLSGEAVDFAVSTGEFARDSYESAAKECPELFGEDADRNAVDDDCFLRDEVLQLRRSVIERSVQEGIYGSHMPKAVGGQGLDAISILLANISMSFGPPCPTALWPDMAGYVMGGAWGPSAALVDAAPEVRDRYLPPLMNGTLTTCIALTDPEAGSDPHFMKGTAHRDGDVWVLNGKKRFVGNGAYADFLLTYMRTSGEPGDITGLSCFVVEESSPGFRVEKILRVMEGIGNHAELSYAGCQVPTGLMVGDEGSGFQVAMREVGRARLGIGARLLGGALWLLQEAQERANSRSTFGVPLKDRQAIQWMLAEVAAECESLRWLLYGTAWKLQRGKNVRKDTAIVKLLGPRVYGKAADAVVQIYGGLGYLASEPYERAYRRARGYRILEGTDEMQLQSIARAVLRGE